MQTECSADLFGFARVERRAVVAGFDGGKMTSDAGALLLGATDRAIRLVDRFAECFTDSRAAELIEHDGQRRWSGSGCLRWRWATKTWSITTSCATTRQWRCWPASCRPAARIARRWPANRRSTGWSGAAPELTRYHRIAWDGAKIEALVCRSVSGSAPTPAEADHPRSRCHRRSAARASGRPLLSRLLRLLLLSAAVHFQRPASVGVKAAARRHRRGPPERSRRRRASSRQIRARWPAGAHCAARRFGVCPRGPDELVRGQWGRFSVWPGQERAAGRRDCRRTRRRRGGQQNHRPAGAPVQGIPVVDARQLEPPAPGDRQGGMDRQARPIRALSSPR